MESQLEPQVDRNIRDRRSRPRPTPPDTRSILCISLLLLPLFPLHAFPPAPHYTLYGIVRDQVGQTITSEGAELILLKGGLEIGRAAIATTPTIQQNYELGVRIDHNRDGTILYTDKAVPARGQFSLVVEMNGALFYPIEISGGLTAGNGSERVRLDLTLGEDTDGDGLPDIWEQWQLYQAGMFPDGNGDWPIDLITRDGDLDGDGRSNHDEYIAGTFAGDPSEFFHLESKEMVGGKVRLEFFGITGKTYALERGNDLSAWVSVPFAIDSATAPEAPAYSATGVGVRSIFVTAIPGPVEGKSREFYRLSVR